MQDPNYPDSCMIVEDEMTFLVLFAIVQDPISRLAVKLPSDPYRVLCPSFDSVDSKEDVSLVIFFCAFINTVCSLQDWISPLCVAPRSEL